MRKMICPRCWGSKTEPVLKGRCVACDGQGAIPDMVLTPHFNLSEFLRSQTAIRKGIPNDPTEAHINNLRTLCSNVLEPLREKFGPIYITSGLRLPSLNSAISGSSKTSAHMEGKAADMIPLSKSVSLKEMMDYLIEDKYIPFDQAIFEGTWLHVGVLSPSGKTRRQTKMMFPNKHGAPVYSKYNPNDPRVQR